LAPGAGTSGAALVSTRHPVEVRVLNRQPMRTVTEGRWEWSASLRAAAAALSIVVLTLMAPGAIMAARRGAPATGAGASAEIRLQQQSGIFKDGGVLAYGAAQFFGSPTQTHLAAPIVAMAATPDGEGYWLLGAGGSVFTYGDAKYFGSAGASRLNAPIVAMAATPDGQGYWLVAADGSVFTYGDARYYRPATSGGPPDPIVGFAPTPDGGGYWMVTTHGAVYAYGDARYYGSLGATDLHNIPVVAIASSYDGRGYWIVQGGGEVVPYGDAPRFGSMRGHPPVAGIAVTPDGRGYWLVCGNGEVDAFGDAKYLGGNNRSDPRPPVSGIVADPAGGGYWLLNSEAFPVRLSRPSSGAGEKIVSVAASQLGPSRDGGNYCNPYGPCEEWCSLFATWVWERAGVPIPRYAFAGDVYHWAVDHTRVVSVRDQPRAGDLVLYGTGPENVGTAPHIGVVAQVWPDGEIDTVEGDAGPGPGGWTSVLVNGPYLPSQSYFANGMPIYGFAVP
jgi:hypothetical protein